MTARLLFHSFLKSQGPKTTSYTWNPNGYFTIHYVNVSLVLVVLEIFLVHLIAYPHQLSLLWMKVHPYPSLGLHRFRALPPPELQNALIYMCFSTRHWSLSSEVIPLILSTSRTSSFSWTYWLPFIRSGNYLAISKTPPVCKSSLDCGNYKIISYD